MGCGKSKHDVASDNTILQRKKSNMNSQENGIETNDTNKNNIVDDVSSSEMQVEQKESENIKEFGVEVGKDDEVVNDVKGEEAEKTIVEEEKKAEAEDGEGKIQETTIAAEGESGKFEKSEEGEKDESLKENEQKINDVDTPDASEEKVPTEDEKEDVSLKEEGIKDTKVSTSEGKEEDLKDDEGQ